MLTWIARHLPLAGRTRPTDPFIEQFQRIVALALSATGELSSALNGNPGDALKRISEIEHKADDAVRQVNRLVDRTFIPPYDKRDIVLLVNRLDDVVDAMRTVVRLIVSYRAMQAADSGRLAAMALSFNEMTIRAVSELKKVVDAMPRFDHDAIRASARAIKAIEDEGDELFGKAVQLLFPQPDQPFTVAMLAWRDIFRQLEGITDSCEHAMNVIVSIARQEGH